MVSPSVQMKNKLKKKALQVQVMTARRRKLWALMIKKEICKVLVVRSTENYYFSYLFFTFLYSNRYRDIELIVAKRFKSTWNVSLNIAWNILVRKQSTLKNAPKKFPLGLGDLPEKCKPIGNVTIELNEKLDEDSRKKPKNKGKWMSNLWKLVSFAQFTFILLQFLIRSIFSTIGEKTAEEIEFFDNANRTVCSFYVEKVGSEYVWRSN